VKSLKIVICGYGRMGHEVEKAAICKGHSIIATIDEASDWFSKKEDIGQGDVVIDFSLPHTASDNTFHALSSGLPIVIGTTGWKPDYQLIEKLCLGNKVGFILGANFSIGMNILFSVQKQLARLTAKVGGYRPSVTETHHIHKKDAPSGTAIHLANDLLSAYPSMDKWVNEHTDDPTCLPIISYREGEVPGTHITTFTSVDDIITLKHEALGRSGLANGAVLAAEWIIGKTGIHSFEEVLGL